MENRDQMQMNPFCSSWSCWCWWHLAAICSCAVIRNKSFSSATGRLWQCNTLRRSAVASAFVRTSSPARRASLSTPQYILSSSFSSCPLSLRRWVQRGQLSATPTFEPIQVLFDSTNHWHRDRTYHPEQPLRISSCVDAIQQQAQHQVELVDVAADSANTRTPSDTILSSESSFVSTVASTNVHRRSRSRSPFTRDELQHARAMLVRAHSEELVSSLEIACQNARQRRIDEERTSGGEHSRNDSDPVSLGHMGYLDGNNPDCYITTESFGVCLRAAAAWIRATHIALLERQRQQEKCADTKLYASSSSASSSLSSWVSTAFALARPPGHHATRTLQNGFCLYNFAAAAALSVLDANPSSRVSILDWDVHYGQGVADILQHHPRARYVSIHQTPAFPYEGEQLQVSGEHSNICTIPIPPMTTWTTGYEETFDRALRFSFEAHVWEPEIVIVCAGFDALESDELASVSLTADDYGRMTTRLCAHLGHGINEKMEDTTNPLNDIYSAKDGSIADDDAPRNLQPKSPPRPSLLPPALVFGLEGGYQLTPGAAGGNLSDALISTIRALLPLRHHRS